MRFAGLFYLVSGERNVKKIKLNRDNLTWGLTAFLTIAACVVFYFIIKGLGSIGDFFGKLISILSPFIWGLVLAYLLIPILNFYERKLIIPLFIKLKKEKVAPGTRPKGARGVSVTMAIITLLLIIVALFYLIIPNTYESIQTIIENTPTYLENIRAWLDNALDNMPQLQQVLTQRVGDLSEYLSNWLSNRILPKMDSILENVTSSIVSVFRGIYNLVIGIIVSAYLLSRKEYFKSVGKRIIYSLFPTKAATNIKKALNFTNDVFMGFIIGKLLDSAIIGVLCYIGCLLLGIPYAVLVSVIVGITNIIPFFGPFIGAVPSALLILVVNPMKCLIFCIFIFLLQQFDGNILGPKILGNSVGINGFWVMFSIILGAGLFGFWGMLLGVPIWVVIYTGCSKLANYLLKKRNLPTDAEVYADMDYIEPDTGKIHYHEHTRKWEEQQKNSTESTEKEEPEKEKETEKQKGNSETSDE
jgi:predicted PurR-regulated permease PerM